jgi:hypothetical protein
MADEIIIDDNGAPDKLQIEAVNKNYDLSGLGGTDSKAKITIARFSLRIYTPGPEEKRVLVDEFPSVVSG